MGFVGVITSRGSSSLLRYGYLLVIFLIRIPNLLKRQFPEDGTAVYLNVLNQASTTREDLAASAACEFLVW